MGAWLAWLERRLNRPALTWARRRALGVAALLVYLAPIAFIGYWLDALRLRGPAGFALVALLAASLPAQRSLYAHVADVSRALRVSLEDGRRSVQNIVGRDVQSLDEAGVARAALESLAENFSDGVVAPLSWLAVGGITGGLLYKAINTADSMIGHRTERYAAFGWAAARLDDLANLGPARLSAVWIVLAAAFSSGASTQLAWRSVWRDAAKHRSPNAGWPEAALAGALGLKLGGPRAYGGVAVDEPTMGGGRADVGPDDLERALKLYRCACFIQAAVFAALMAISLF